MPASVRPAPRGDAQRNRRRILEAARRLFAESPAASVADVAAAAGLTRTTVYRHFPHRDDLLDALVVELAAHDLPPLLDELARRPLPEALDLLAHGVVDLAGRHRHLIEATAQRFHQVARTAVADEPVIMLLAAHPDRVASDQGVDWLARGVRALCLAAVGDDRPAPEVAADLARSLRRLVLA